MSAGTKKKMLEIKRSKFTEIWLIPFAGVFVALYISDCLKKPISEIGANLHKVRLQESPNNAAEVYTDSINPLQV